MARPARSRQANRRRHNSATASKPRRRAVVRLRTRRRESPPRRNNRVVLNNSNGAAELENRRLAAQYQAAVKNFEVGLRHFHKQNFEKAKDIFEKLAGSPIIEVAERARIHLHLCGHKVARATPPPKTAEDSYNMGVAALNDRNLSLAVEYLTRADKLAMDHEHIRYALAAAYALQSDADTALGHLQAAIQLRPENRFLARQDEDFQSLVEDPRFKRLVG